MKRQPKNEKYSNILLICVSVGQKIHVFSSVNAMIIGGECCGG